MKLDKFRSVSESELVLMRILWDNGGVALYADIERHLKEQKFDWPRNMVLILLRRLIDKGFVKIKKIGRRNEYSVLVSREEYNAAEAMQLINRLYDGDINGLVNTLGRLVPKTDREELRNSWERGNDDE